jgi:hypothetical protein
MPSNPCQTACSFLLQEIPHKLDGGSVNGVNSAFFLEVYSLPGRYNSTHDFGATTLGLLLNLKVEIISSSKM